MIDREHLRLRARVNARYAEAKAANDERYLTQTLYALFRYYALKPEPTLAQKRRAELKQHLLARAAARRSA